MEQALAPEKRIAGTSPNGPVIPALFFLSPLVTSAAPRLTWLFLLLIAVAFIVAFLRQGGDWRQLFQPNAVLIAFLVLAAYVFLSTTWAADPRAAFEKSAILLGTVLVTFAASSALPALDEQQLRRATLAFAAGAFAGALFVIFELWSGGAITRMALKTVTLLQPPTRAKISAGEVMRIKTGAFRENAALVLFNLWPGLLALGVIANRMRRIASATLFIIATAIVVFLSERLSAQVALLGSMVTFPLARIGRRSFLNALAVLWCLVFVLVLPVSFSAYNAGLHTATWLPKDSARVRVIIWEYTAERVLEHPWFGIGASSTPALRQPLEHSERPEGFVYPRNTGRHAHNFFLQTWYELGLVGAILFAFAGAVLILRISLLPFEARPFAAATFATVGTAAAFATSMWQTWLDCSVGLLILYLRTAQSSSFSGSRDVQAVPDNAAVPRNARL